MSNETPTYEPQSLLDVREWKRKASEEIERLGFNAYAEQCRNDPSIKAIREEIERNRQTKQKKAA